MEKIIRNSAKCLICMQELESTHRHDYRKCKCGNLMVDGGKDYIRRGWKDFDMIEETSILEEDNG